LRGPSGSKVAFLREPRLSDELFVQLRDMIYSKSGMFFNEGKKYLLERRVKDRLKELGLEKFEDYYYLLRYSPDGEEEFRALLDEITINETSFYRNAPQMEVFQRYLLPEVLKVKKVKQLKLWSAGCSTGEEPYTLAILILEVLGAGISEWSVDILAVDISQSALKKARKGEYGHYTLRNMPLHLVQKYFLKDGPTYKVREEVKKLVRFEAMNLLDRSQTNKIRGMDFVFCRNVLIYFDTEARRRVVASFYESLNPGGYLFIGHSESLHDISRSFDLVHFPKVIVYKKNERISAVTFHRPLVL